MTSEVNELVSSGLTGRQDMLMKVSYLECSCSDFEGDALLNWEPM